MHSYPGSGLGRSCREKRDFRFQPDAVASRRGIGPPWPARTTFPAMRRASSPKDKPLE
jgi:hypothetical protein